MPSRPVSSRGRSRAWVYGGLQDSSSGGQPPGCAEMFLEGEVACSDSSPKAVGCSLGAQAVDGHSGMG